MSRPRVIFPDPTFILKYSVVEYSTVNFTSTLTLVNHPHTSRLVLSRSFHKPSYFVKKEKRKKESGTGHIPYFVKSPVKSPERTNERVLTVGGKEKD